MRPTVCRRKHHRHMLPQTRNATVRFGYPGPKSPACTMIVRDLSAAGLSFVLADPLPGLEPGQRLDAAEVSIGDRMIRGDLLVMHITPEVIAGAVLGALFYPATDDDLLTLRSVLAELEAEVHPDDGRASLAAGAARL